MLPALVTACLMFMNASIASALTMTGTACQIGSLSGSTACEGIFDGNDANQSLDGLFGLSGWVQIEKVNASSGSSNSANLNLIVTQDALDAKSGTWNIDGYASFNPVMFVLKGGPTFSAFLMDPGFTSGTWDTMSNQDGSGALEPGLSHFTIYAVTTVVPLPAALPLFASGLGLLGFMGWRRKQRPAV